MLKIIPIVDVTSFLTPRYSSSNTIGSSAIAGFISRMCLKCEVQVIL